MTVLIFFLIVTAVLVRLLFMVDPLIYGRGARHLPHEDWGAETAMPPAEGAAPVAVAADSERGRQESILVAELLAGQLPAAEYRQAMARLAADDAAVHPRVMPPDRNA